MLVFCFFFEIFKSDQFWFDGVSRGSGLSMHSKRLLVKNLGFCFWHLILVVSVLGGKILSTQALPLHYQRFLGIEARFADVQSMC